MRSRRKAKVVPAPERSSKRLFCFGGLMPTRYLKPGIRDSDAIDRLSPLAETMFYRLLVTVDDFGRYDARPSLIKSQCFPVKDSLTPDKCLKLLQELADVRLVQLYTIDGKAYLQVLKWDNKPRATVSNFPAPVDTCIQTYTDVLPLHTNLPVTVTVTETKTETGTKTETPPEGVLSQTWADFLQIRKAKRAPMTETSLTRIRKEAGKAGLSLQEALETCCSRGWQGFEASWVQKQTINGHVNKQEALEASNRAVVERLLAKEAQNANQ